MGASQPAPTTSDMGSSTFSPGSSGGGGPWMRDGPCPVGTHQNAEESQKAGACPHLLASLRPRLTDRDRIRVDVGVASRDLKTRARVHGKGLGGINAAEKTGPTVWESLGCPVKDPGNPIVRPLLELAEGKWEGPSGGRPEDHRVRGCSRDGEVEGLAAGHGEGGDRAPGAAGGLDGGLHDPAGLQWTADRRDGKAQHERCQDSIETSRRCRDGCVSWYVHDSGVVLRCAWFCRAPTSLEKRTHSPRPTPPFGWAIPPGRAGHERAAPSGPEARSAPCHARVWAGRPTSPWAV